jgi:hypothetical protein
MYVMLFVDGLHLYVRTTSLTKVEFTSRFYVCSNNHHAELCTFGIWPHAPSRYLGLVHTLLNIPYTSLQFVLRLSFHCNHCTRLIHGMAFTDLELQ